MGSAHTHKAKSTHTPSHIDSHSLTLTEPSSVSVLVLSLLPPTFLCSVLCLLYPLHQAASQPSLPTEGASEAAPQTAEAHEGAPSAETHTPSTQSGASDVSACRSHRSAFNTSVFHFVQHPNGLSLTPFPVCFVQASLV